MMYDVYESVPDLLKDQARVLRASFDGGQYDWPPKPH